MTRREGKELGHIVIYSRVHQYDVRCLYGCPYKRKFECTIENKLILSMDEYIYVCRHCTFFVN